MTIDRRSSGGVRGQLKANDDDDDEMMRKLFRRSSALRVVSGQICCDACPYFIGSRSIAVV